MEWQEEAACLNADWDMTNSWNVTQSKRLCGVCPVQQSCYVYAMTDHAVGIPGVLAGLTESERGQVTCVTCPAIVRKVNTRRGQCWSCYKQSPVAA